MIRNYDVDWKIEVTVLFKCKPYVLHEKSVTKKKLLNKVFPLSKRLVG